MQDPEHKNNWEPHHFFSLNYYHRLMIFSKPRNHDMHKILGDVNLMFISYIRNHTQLHAILKI